ncbi:MAG: hypothetical protein KAR40_00130 [Candidatus Sabulitectum sp.]|nr:hypothetical protein [Candidatus Sabulitectum sp.]
MKPRGNLEQLIVEKLIHRLEQRLADRGGDTHPPGWEPKQNVVLGVLDPVFAVSKENVSSKEVMTDVAAVDHTEAFQSIGIVFVAKTNTAIIQVSVDLDFAIYMEEYASREEQIKYHNPIIKYHEEESSDFIEKDESLKSDCINEREEAKSQPRKRTSRLVSTWRRHNIVVRDIQLHIPINGEHIEISEVILKEVKDVINAHFTNRDASRSFLGRTRTLAMVDLQNESSYWDAIKAAEDPEYLQNYPNVKLIAFAEPLGNGSFLADISLANSTILKEYPFQNLSIYDCRIRISPGKETEIKYQRFILSPDDYRYKDSCPIIGHGKGCVAVEEDGCIVSTTLPRYSKKTVESRCDHVPSLRWADLSLEPESILEAVSLAMKDYLTEWNVFIETAPISIKEASSVEQAMFAEEIKRFELGRDAMNKDSKLKRAFQLSNKVFDNVNAKRNYDSWRLFQLVYIVTLLPSLAVRESPNNLEYQYEHEFADVLWFPTGGGKTEAYLGLLVVALFYDRLRGKSKGVTAWLKFPLRMLSVQQLFRVLRVLIVAEEIRIQEVLGNGEPFSLGYLVGGSNTPNSLLNKRGWWPGIDSAESIEANTLEQHKLIAECPYCGKKTIRLRPEKESIRLFHTCTSCLRDLPLYVTDDEVYRYMPSVIVGTIDKLSGFAFFGEFTQFTHGPRYFCPDHGWFSFFRNGKCLAGKHCNRSKREYRVEESWYDPVPALIIQDELHLLKEELGVFNAHYEGMLTDLQRRGPSGLPSKILAASATIELYEDQLRQIYARRPRYFPSQGFKLQRSFYNIEKSTIQRLFVGILPHYRRKADVSAIVQTELLKTVKEMQDASKDELGKCIGYKKIDGELFKDALFNYEVSLAYVNAKTNGDYIADELGMLSEEFENSGQDTICYRVLTGEVIVSELADTIERVEKDTLDMSRAKRIRALVGTSVISHGVDLSRLNILVMTGLPPTIADYIQATSRAGRTHIGLVVTVFDTFNRKQRSTYTNFNSFHHFLDRMVEPVPVNRFALFGADKTLPGIIMAHLWDMSRQDEFVGPEEGIKKTRNLSKWWRAKSSILLPILRERLVSTYKSYIEGVNEEELEKDLIQRVVSRWENVELLQMQAFNTDNSTELFRSGVLSSFRSIDDLVEFTAVTYSRKAYAALLGDDNDINSKLARKAKVVKTGVK